MPRKARDRDATPRRRGAAAIEQADERGLAMRLITHSPKDLVAAMFASAAVLAIIINAIFMQAGRHPSPMFGSASAPQVVTLPRPRPVEAARPADPRMIDLKAVDSRPVEIKPIENRAADPAPTTAKATPVTTPRPPAPIPAAGRTDPLGDLITSSRRVASVQRALTEYGYGQLKPTGTVGSDTQAAIQRFERDRKLPVTGQMSDRLAKELTLVTGRPID